MPKRKMNAKDEQLTVRVPTELANAVEQFAYEKSIPKSMVVREALATYMTNVGAAPAGSTWTNVSHLVGSLSLDRSAVERDELARAMRAHNWRS